MKQEIHQFILRALRSADGEPIGEKTLKAAIRQAFMNVAFTEADLTLRLQFCEQQGWIIGTADQLIGTSWTLTIKGRLASAQLT